MTTRIALIPILPNPFDDTVFLNGAGEWTTPPAPTGATIQGTATVLQMGNGPDTAIDSQIQDHGNDGIHFFLGDLGHGALDLLSIKRLNFADVHITGESGADILMESGTGGSFTIQTDGGLGDNVVLRCGEAGNVAVKITPDRILLQVGCLEADTADIAGTLTLVAGTVRYDFVKQPGAGRAAVVTITPQSAPAGILSVASDATGFTVSSSDAGDGVIVNYVCMMVIVPA